MEIHLPDIYGPIELAGNAGTAGQRLTSAGPAATPTWEPDVNSDEFQFISPSALTHTITHNLGNIAPTVTVYLTSDGRQVQPAYIDALDANTLEINFFVARAIQGTVVG